MRLSKRIGYSLLAGVSSTLALAGSFDLEEKNPLLEEMRQRHASPPEFLRRFELDLSTEDLARTPLAPREIKIPYAINALPTEVYSLEVGMYQLDALDQWYFHSLKTVAERKEQAELYTLNQQRLYLLTQIKRLEIEAKKAFGELETLRRRESLRSSQRTATPDWQIKAFEKRLDLMNASRTRYQAALIVQQGLIAEQSKPLDVRSPWPLRRFKHPDDVIRLLAQNQQAALKALEQIKASESSAERLAEFERFVQSQRFSKKSSNRLFEDDYYSKKGFRAESLQQQIAGVETEQLEEIVGGMNPHLSKILRFGTRGDRSREDIENMLSKSSTLKDASAQERMLVDELLNRKFPESSLENLDTEALTRKLAEQNPKMLQDLERAQGVSKNLEGVSSYLGKMYPDDDEGSLYGKYSKKMPGAKATASQRKIAEELARRHYEGDSPKSKRGRANRSLVTGKVDKPLYYLESRITPLELPAVDSIAQFKMPPPSTQIDPELSDTPERRRRLEQLRAKLDDHEVKELDKLLNEVPDSLRAQHVHYQVSAYVDGLLKPKDSAKELRTATENVRDSLTLNHAIAADVRNERKAPPSASLGEQWAKHFAASRIDPSKGDLSKEELAKRGVDHNQQRFEFLKKLGIDTQAIENPDAKSDLSALYPEPVKQVITDPVTGEERWSVTCVGMAWAADMSTHLDSRTKARDQISGPHAYATIQTAIRTGAVDKKLSPDSLAGIELKTIEDYVPIWLPQYRQLGDTKFTEMVGESRLPIGNILKNNPVALKSEFSNLRPLTPDDLAKGKYKVVDVATLQLKQAYRQIESDPFEAGYGSTDPKREHITYDYVASLLSKNVSPMAFVDTDERRFVEDWYTIPRNAGDTGHVMNIVGHGNDAVDPVTLQPTEYFIVRDSFVAHPIHYRVPARDVLRHLWELEKVTKIERVDAK